MLLDLDGNKLVGVINGTTPSGRRWTTPPGGGGTTPPGGGGTTPGAAAFTLMLTQNLRLKHSPLRYTMLNLGHDLLTTAGYENAALAVDGEGRRFC